MIHSTELHRAGFLIQRTGVVCGNYGMTDYESYCLIADNAEPCGILRVAVSTEIDNERSGIEVAQELFDDADACDDDSVRAARAIAGSMESSPEFFKTLMSCMNWSHIDYCFVDKEHRGQGIGALFVLAWMETYAPQHFITAIPELAAPKLVRYWKEKAGFTPVDESDPSGVAYRVSPNGVHPEWVSVLNYRIGEHKEAVHSE